ncbi:hypothetical protein M446_6198 [Methylobacterium sp. 4-46]|uniref:hypothetical protein n=1 Tax=unclassified Methylobacterium TaxID=2615210 RepID=UPI000152D887|nr:MULTISPECIES: hypothetical protein [Methylobacterium]ACA20466.1 hypothetical protein M446_6198 [Methylobacterium sp. 4-46]WFT79634.1 hypothetical protein QA634_31280 [Methylobacterium nodulans]
MASDAVTTQDAIRVKPTQDGTYTVYRGTSVLVSGLTRAQAELYEASIIQQARLAREAPAVRSVH